jgi:hydroxyacylglutathione hydrolase
MAKLEDSFGDIVNKARRGRKWTEAEVGKRAGLTEQQVQDIQGYKLTPDDGTIRKLAGVLGLDPDRLVASARESYSPTPIDLSRWNCAAQIPTTYEDMVVNTYLVWDKNSKEAVLFDTGADARPIEDVVAKRSLQIRLLCMTHTHVDHVAALDEVRKRYSPPVIASKAEPVDGARFAREGDVLRCGTLSIKVLETDGHSPGGFTFVVTGLGAGIPDMAVVGDAIFAGSMGGPMVSYERLHSNVKNKILTLKEDTVLMPGHGPLTTVGEERRNNPFFP